MMLYELKKPKNMDIEEFEVIVRNYMMKEHIMQMNSGRAS